MGEGQQPSASHRKGEREFRSERISGVLVGLEIIERVVYEWKSM